MTKGMGAPSAYPSVVPAITIRATTGMRVEDEYL